MRTVPFDLFYDSTGLVQSGQDATVGIAKITRGRTPFLFGHNSSRQVVLAFKKIVHVSKVIRRLKITPSCCSVFLEQSREVGDHVRVFSLDVVRLFDVGFKVIELYGW